MELKKVLLLCNILFLHLMLLIKHSYKNVKIMKRACYLLLSLIFWSGCLLAQSVDRRQLIDSSAVEYLRIVGSQSALYYGKAQEGHPRTTNHPYLKDALFTKARLSYFGVIYPEALLRLDLSRDELIVSPGFRNIVLFSENVDFAELHGRHIIYFRRDSLPGSPSTGFYFLLHSGKCRVLEKQTAVFTFSSSTGEQYYALSTNFYLYKDGIYHTIRNKRGLLKVLHPYKKELKRFISAHRWQFRHDAEELIKQTVSEYEKLSGSL